MIDKDLIAIVKLLNEAGKLKKVFRSGWLDVGVSSSDVESVADHTFRVALISMIVCDYIREAKPNMKIDIEKTIRMALVHDLAETKIGDLHLTATVYIGKKSKERAEIRAFEDLFKEMPPEIRSRYIEIFKEYVAEGTIEARIVRCADIIDMLLQADYYKNVGYPKEILKDFWHLEEYMKMCGLPVFKELLTFIIEAWENKK